ncbi:hypothetical protein NDU88_007590 [Pleurodeles waltl]|uniref:Uncharacterized protein n=1 Tax=Pleurodeles waltl TaxID=8319 RepID=A0AAV7N2I1_PLEWA|nr:hypothetical protein NDU88_007590 [Pleurodeles waltl]
MRVYPAVYMISVGTGLYMNELCRRITCAPSLRAQDTCGHRASSVKCAPSLACAGYLEETCLLWAARCTSVKRASSLPCADYLVLQTRRAAQRREEGGAEGLLSPRPLLTVLLNRGAGRLTEQWSLSEVHKPDAT